MSILLDRESRVIVQGITGRLAAFHTARMLEYGTRIVAGVTPGRGGEELHGIPIYDSVADALAEHPADVSAILVPPAHAADAIFEAADAGIPLLVCMVEGIPVRDMMLVRRRLRESRTLLLGPNSPGIISPGRSLCGYMPAQIFTPGPVGVVSRSGTFSYLVARHLTQAGLGQTTCVGIGGDPITGVGYPDILARFEADPETEVIVLIGEIGRTAEEEAAEYIRSHVTKPVVAIVLGATAPPGRQMGHAGAIIANGRGTYESKVRALEAAGVRVARSAAEVPGLVRQALAGSRRPAGITGARGSVSS